MIANVLPSKLGQVEFTACPIILGQADKAERSYTETYAKC